METTNTNAPEKIKREPGLGRSFGPLLLKLTGLLIAGSIAVHGAGHVIGKLLTPQTEGPPLGSTYFRWEDRSIVTLNKDATGQLHLDETPLYLPDVPPYTCNGTPTIEGSRQIFACYHHDPANRAYHSVFITTDERGLDVTRHQDLPSGRSEKAPRVDGYHFVSNTVNYTDPDTASHLRYGIAYQDNGEVSVITLDAEDDEVLAMKTLDNTGQLTSEDVYYTSMFALPDQGKVVITTSPKEIGIRRIFIWDPVEKTTSQVTGLEGTRSDLSVVTVLPNGQMVLRENTGDRTILHKLNLPEDTAAYDIISYDITPFTPIWHATTRDGLLLSPGDTISPGMCGFDLIDSGNNVTHLELPLADPTNAKPNACFVANKGGRTR